jgi:hypothetical protein
VPVFESTTTPFSPQPHPSSLIPDVLPTPNTIPHVATLPPTPIAYPPTHLSTSFTANPTQNITQNTTTNQLMGGNQQTTNIINSNNVTTSSQLSPQKTSKDIQLLVAPQMDPIDFQQVNIFETKISYFSHIKSFFSNIFCFFSFFFFTNNTF